MCTYTVLKYGISINTHGVYIIIILMRPNINNLNETNIFSASRQSQPVMHNEQYTNVRRCY